MLGIFAAGKDMSNINVVACTCTEILRVAKQDMVKEECLVKMALRGVRLKAKAF